MSGSILFYPAFAQVILTFVLLFFTGKSRVASIRNKETKIKDVALGQDAWPQQQTQFANSYNSQFQLPVLFYTALIFADLNGLASITLLVLAWGFVVTRIAHAVIHVTTNDVSRRFYTFTAGFGLLVLMWGFVAVSLLIAVK